MTDNRVRVQRGGTGSRVLLLLLHGLGATSDVWNGWHALLDRSWPGRWLAPDLPGHGGSAPLADYTFASLAASMADVVTADVVTADGQPCEQVVVLGHSLGGAIALALAGRGSDLPITAVVGLGIKVAWTEEDLERVRALAQRPVTWFPDRGEAATRYLRISGLTGLLSPDDPAVTAGLREEGGTWRLAMDPATFAVAGPDMPDLLASSRASVVLARGEHDAMVTDEQLAALGVPTQTLAGLGHNAHVESPESVLRLLPSPSFSSI